MQVHMKLVDAVKQTLGYGRLIKGSDWQDVMKQKGAYVDEIAKDSQKLAAWGIVELLRRLSGEPSEAVNASKPLCVSEDSAKFQSTNVGDCLYRYDTECGLATYLVVAKDEQGHCMTVESNDFDLDDPPRVRIATDDMHTTDRAAMLKSLSGDLEYHAPRYEFAKAALKAIEDSADLTPFVGGFDEEDEE